MVLEYTWSFGSIEQVTLRKKIIPVRRDMLFIIILLLGFM